jgi:hypothetical protein
MLTAEMEMLKEMMRFKEQRIQTLSDKTSYLESLIEASKIPSD